MPSAAYVIAAIDFNQDQFFSKDEIVVPSTIIATNQLVSLPAFKACNPNRIAGKTRFRIVSGNKPFAPDFDFCTLDPEMKGEIEDYTVNLGSIIAGPPLNEKSGAKELGDVIVYPNPAKESVKWNAPVSDDINYELSVTDFMGTPVLRGSGIGSEGIFDTSKWPNGVYLIKFVNSKDGTSFVGRVSVSK